jgi:serine protease Do
MKHHRLLTVFTLLALEAGSAAQQAAKIPEIKVDNAPLPANAPSYAPVVEKVAPCIVTISTSRNVTGRDLPNLPNLRDPFFRRFFGLPDEEEEPRTPRRNAPGRTERPQKQMMGLGSGVVVSPEGHILTNNHVIDGADDIIVTLGNGRQEYKATQIGTDPSTDLAVLKIDAEKLTAITFTDSDRVRIGDVVLAVGNPFGLTRSVSAGIVSSIGRSGMRMAAYENYIQTDASINPGNSGGALVDSQGRLVGINTSIFSRSGGNEGIGFAVPSNLARNVMENLLKHGRVIRGFLGVSMEMNVTDALAKELKIPAEGGVVVTSVEENSPAEKAGIKTYDVIVGIDDRKIVSPQELRLMVSALTPGTKLEIKVQRDGQPKNFTVELAELPAEKLAGLRDPVKPAASDPDVLDGVEVADVDSQLRRELGLPDDAKGAVVTKIDPESPSAEAGIKVGDIIQEIARKPVANAREAIAMSEQVKKDKKVLLLISTRGASRFVMVERKE